MRILITGAGGFVGRYLVPLLSERFSDAKVFSSDCDVVDERAVKAAFEIRPTAVIHLAGISAFSEARTDTRRAWQINLHGTLNVARAVIEQAPNARLIFAGTSQGYGAGRGIMPIDESAPLAPVTAYAATKAAADLALGALAAEGLRCIRLRLFNHTGPSQSTRFVVGSLARQIADIAAGRARATVSVGSLESQRDFLDVRDVCEAYVACIRADPHLPSDLVFNVASGVARRVGDILDELLAIAGVSAEIASESQLLRAMEPSILVGDSDRIRDQLGWSPRIAWERTLSDMLAFWLNTQP